MFLFISVAEIILSTLSFEFLSNFSRFRILQGVKQVSAKPKFNTENLWYCLSSLQFDTKFVKRYSVSYGAILKIIKFSSNLVKLIGWTFLLYLFYLLYPMIWKCRGKNSSYFNFNRLKSMWSLGSICLLRFLRRISI